STQPPLIRIAWPGAAGAGGCCAAAGVATLAAMAGAAIAPTAPVHRNWRRDMSPELGPPEGAPAVVGPQAPHPHEGAKPNLPPSVMESSRLFEAYRCMLLPDDSAI